MWLKHVAADGISFAATFLQKSLLTHSVAAPLRIEPAIAGLRFGFFILIGASFFVNASHVVADCVSFATAFSYLKQTPSLIHSVAPPFKIVTANAGLRFCFLKHIRAIAVSLRDGFYALSSADERSSRFSITVPTPTLDSESRCA